MANPLITLLITLLIAWLPTRIAAFGAKSALPESLCGIVEEHNTLRAHHGAPALEWDSSLAAHAQGWADKFGPGGEYYDAAQPCGVQHIQTKDPSYSQGSTCASATTAPQMQETTPDVRTRRTAPNP